MFSVVIPTFNRAENIAELLENLRQQTFNNFEVIVCDDGSQDNTQEVVESFKYYLDIKYYYNENWGGPARPRNIGINHSNFEWICFLDSDDLWHKDKLKRCKIAIDKYPSVGMIFHEFEVKQANGDVRAIGKYYPDNREYKNFKKLAAGGNKIVLSSICVRREILKDLGGFSEDKDLVGVEDFELILRLALNNVKFMSLCKVLGEYRLSGTNISSDELSQIDKQYRMLTGYSNDYSELLPPEFVESLTNYMIGSKLMGSDKVTGKHFLDKVILSSGLLSLRLKAVYKRFL